MREREYFLPKLKGNHMSLSITIPGEIVETVKAPRSQVRQTLYREMAFALYARGLASLGAARRLAKLDKFRRGSNDQRRACSILA